MSQLFKFGALLLGATLLSGCVTTGSSPGAQNPLSGLLADGQLKGMADVLPDSPYKNLVSGALDAGAQWTPEHERKIGREMAAQLLGARPLYKNAAAQRYVNQVGTWIALQTGESGHSWRFGIIDTPSLNAFAAPGGYVFITRGLLLRLQSEAELAGVLAHEIGHVLKQHHLYNLKKQGLGQMALAVVEAKTGAGNNEAIRHFAKNIYTSGLDKSDEYEADRVGVVLATRAGYSPFGLPAVLQMYAASPQDAALALLFATHPAAGERLTALDTQMADQFDRYSSGLSATSRFTRIQRLASYPASAKKGGKKT